MCGGKKKDTLTNVPHCSTNAEGDKQPRWQGAGVSGAVIVREIHSRTNDVQKKK